MKKVFIALLLGFSLVSSVPQTSFAEAGGPADYMGRCGGMEAPVPPPMHHEMGIPHGLPEMMMHGHHMWMEIMRLPLDENQKARIEKIKNALMKENAKRSADIRIAIIDMKELLDKEQVDMKSVESKLKQIGSLISDLQLSHIKAMEDVKKILTPEQKKKFRAMLVTEFQRGPMPHHGPIAPCNCENVEKP